MENHPVRYFILGVQTLTDARYFSAMGVEFLHFDLNPDSYFSIDQHTFQAIIAWVEGSSIICSFDHLFEEDQIRAIVEDQSVSGVLSKHPDLLNYVHRIRPELKLFQQVNSEEEIDHHLLLTGVITIKPSETSGNEYLLCSGPLEAQLAVKDGVSRIAIHPGSEDEVGIKDFEAYDRLLYQEFE